MPGRQIVGGELYRYAFQGQEKDPETGKEAFQLRLWDGRIGRWLSPDPYGQFASPYIGMGNNPISLIDPNGGCVGPDCVEGPAGTIGTDQNGLEWTWDGDAWNTNFSFGLKEVLINGQGNGLNGIASVRFEQFTQIIMPDITRRNENWKGAYGIALSPFMVIAGIEGATFLVSTASSLNTASAAEAVSGDVSYMVNQGLRKLVLRAPKGGLLLGGTEYAGGTFLPDTGALLTDQMFYQLYGLSNTGEAIELTPVVAHTVSKIPIWIRWLIAGGGSAAALNLEKEEHKQDAKRK
ncbi:MAG: hypothetical protein CVU01_01240 [Bacteroidetes bacterium HGW-Bacteroidetes-18]|nr:MAG: hypothetical protein CVU01_01240 [Bacteroidetes bacterium HGW-Bacteroidetes-18]